MASMDAINSPIPTPDHDTTVVVVVFVSLGCVMFLAFLAFVICFMIKKKCKKNSDKSEIVRVDEHYKMNEAIVEGPHGPEAVVLSVEDDVHIEDLVKREKMVGKDGLVGSSRS
ncbi:tracheary element differentiation-related 6 [Raphanus sativus]|uniref:Protein TRACHEARY ELEMENT DIFFERENTIATION-RELATED 6 n=1 Tax=Raphanus sativus TaxID=3726 RepID=A0A6J0LLA1_RAPSA|nr:protein TRACHEARY ELEMENT DIFFERENTIATION-RELATED 6 [Raphanus sativus]KAJ4917283.1 tracheary element differentiation-related 6 [Raphanus sativus]